MVQVIDWKALNGRSESSFLFEGESFGARISMFATDPPPGGGPVLHRHPYEEVFYVHEGTARFQAGEETLVATAGHVVVVPANTPHKFVNITDGRVHVFSVHYSPVVIQEDLE